MPTKCYVKGCASFVPGKSFFYLPAVLSPNYYSVEKVDLSKKRRTLWLEAIGIEDDDPSKKVLVCSDHFLTGRPSSLEECTSIDWVPSLHMRLPHTQIDKRRKEEVGSLTGTKNAFTSSISPQVDTKSHSSKKGINRKSLNCKVLDGNLRSNTFNGTNGSGLTIVLKSGKFTSDNVTLRETSINSTVLRIRIINDDLRELQRKYKSVRSESKENTIVSSFGRQIKKKMMFFPDYEEASPIKRERVSEEREMFNISDSYLNSSQVIKKTSIQSKLQSKSFQARQSPEKSKTLNRVIKKNDRSTFKVKFFPKVASTPTRNAVKNGSVNIRINEKPLSLRREILFVNQLKTPVLYNDFDRSYYLKFPLNYRRHEDGKLKYPFQKLVLDVKQMKLPAPNWKIKVIIRRGRISALIFTNKLPVERCISFSAGTDLYRIVIDNKPALLLGSPSNITCANDLEVLMDIIHNIDAKNTMILYK